MPTVSLSLALRDLAAADLPAGSGVPDGLSRAQRGDADYLTSIIVMRKTL